MLEAPLPVDTGKGAEENPNHQHIVTRLELGSHMKDMRIDYQFDPLLPLNCQVLTMNMKLTINLFFSTLHSSHDSTCVPVYDKAHLF